MLPFTIPKRVQKHLVCQTCKGPLIPTVSYLFGCERLCSRLSGVITLLLALSGSEKKIQETALQDLDDHLCFLQDSGVITSDQRQRLRRHVSRTVKVFREQGDVELGA